MTRDCNNRNTDPDVSNIIFPGEFKTFPAWEIGLKITVIVVIELVAILGNLLVIFIILQSRKMRTVTNYYIINLALSDLSVACFSIWIHVVDDLTQGWVMGSFLCKFNPFVQITAMCASVFTLVAIAGDRFFAIMLPLRSHVVRRKVSVTVIIIWLAAISIGMPVLFIYTYGERQWRNFFEGYCVEVWPQKLKSDGECDIGLTSQSAYWICVFVVLNWVPMVVMMVVYTVILHRLHRSRTIPRCGTLTISAIQQRSKRKVVTMLFTILMVFILCAVPFQLAKLYELFRNLENSSETLPAWYNPVYFAAVTLLYTNSALNPILYGGLNENFRTGFKNIIQQVCRRRNLSDTYASSVEDRRQSQITIMDNSVTMDTRSNGRNGNSEDRGHVIYMNNAYNIDESE